MWKTVDFPNSQKGFTFSIVLQILLSELHSAPKGWHLQLVFWTTLVILLLRRDKRKALKAEGIDSGPLGQLEDGLSRPDNSDSKSLERGL